MMGDKLLKDMTDPGYERNNPMSGFILSEIKYKFKLMEKLDAKSQHEIRREFSELLEKKLLPITTKQDDAVSKNRLVNFWRSCEKAFASKQKFNALKYDLNNLYANKSELNTLKFDLDKSNTDLACLQSWFKDLDDFINSWYGRIQLYNKNLEISTADLKTLNATPIEILPSPGPGKYIEVKRFELFLDYGTAAYTAVDAGKDLSLGYTSAGELIQIETTGFLDQSSDQRRCSHHPDTHPVGVDEAVLLSMLVGEVATGDSPLKLSIDYRIVTALT
jgi:hypothetical protein